MAFATPTSPRMQPPKSGAANPAQTNTSRPDSAPAHNGARPNQPRQAHQQYRRAQIETASPTRLVVLLYDGAIRFCSLAREAMQKHDLEMQRLLHEPQNTDILKTQRILRETQNTNLKKVQHILGELMSSLDREAGGEVASNLFHVYAHMLEQLVHANLYDQVEPVDSVLQMLRDLRESWQELDLRVTQGQGQERRTPAPEAAVPTPPTRPTPARKASSTADAKAAALPPQKLPAHPGVSGRLGDCNA
jgi:flagellar protein FliS